MIKFIKATCPEEHRLFKAALELSKAKPNTVEWFDALHRVLLCASLNADS